MQPQVRLLGDRYELQYVLASGGMGRVWRARDTLLQRPVAVKILRSEFTGNPDFLGRFRAEAQHTAVLAHPNIAALYDYGELDQDGEHLAYLVMELVEGESLATLLHRERRLDVPQTLGIMRATAAGLAAAHAAGVVHRDVKPGNVLLGPAGVVKITDFGIAWSASSVPLTQTGQVIGTAQYLSPEQAAGGKAGPGERRLRPRRRRLRVPDRPPGLRRGELGADRGQADPRRARPAARRAAGQRPQAWSSGRCARTRPSAFPTARRSWRPSTTCWRGGRRYRPARTRPQ